MKKRILGTILSLAMVLTLLPAISLTANAAAAPGGPAITNLGELKTALGDNQTDSATTGTVTLTGNLELAAPIVITDGTYTIDGGNYTITASGDTWDSGMLQISGTAAVTLKKITLDADGKCRVINVGTGGALDLTGGSADDIVTITGGFTTATSDNNGGAGLRLTSTGIVTVTGGTINVEENVNQASSSNGGEGGGIFLTQGNGTFTVSGGVLNVTNNSSVGHGGGIGIGIHTNAGNPSFSITGGTVNVSGNTAGQRSGGIHLGQGTYEFAVTGGNLNVTNNFTTASGYGAISSGGGGTKAFSIGNAKVVVKDNENVTDGVERNVNRVIKLTATPAADSDIGITYGAPTAAAPVTFTDNAQATVACLEFFFADDPLYRVIFDGTNEMQLAVKTPVFVGSTGNDTTGNGTYDLPYATFSKAYTEVGDDGIIGVKDDVTVDATVTFGADKNVTIQSYRDVSTVEDSAPFAIKRGTVVGAAANGTAGSGSVFYVTTGSVTLENIILDGQGGNTALVTDGSGVTLTGSVTSYAPLLAVNGTAEVTLGAGSAVQNNRNSGSASSSNNKSAIRLLAEDSKLIIDGGEVRYNLEVSGGTHNTIGGAGSVEMISGSIHNNSTGTTNGPTVGSAITMTGGSIVNNIANGGACTTLTIDTDTAIDISGNTTAAGVERNVYLATSKTITLTGTPYAGSTIGVTPQIWPTQGGKVPASVGSGYTAVTTDAQYFFSDQPEKAGIIFDTDNKIYLAYDARFGAGIDNTTGSGYIAIPSSASGSTYEVTGPDGYTATGTVDANGTTLPDLIPGGEYTVKIDSAPDLIVTIPAIDLNAYAAADGESITVYPADPNAKYAVYAANDLSGTPAGTWTAGDQSEVTFSGLAPDTEYVVVALPKDDGTSVNGTHASAVPVKTPSATLTEVTATRNSDGDITVTNEVADQEYAVIDLTTGEVVAGWDDGTTPYTGLDPDKPYKVITREPGSLPGGGLTFLPGLSDAAKDNVTGDDESITINPTDPNLWYAIVDSTGAIVENVDASEDWVAGGSPITWSGLDDGTEYSVVTLPKTGTTPPQVKEPIGGSTVIVTAPTAVGSITRTDNGGKDQLVFATTTSNEYAVVKKGADPDSATWVTGNTSGTGNIFDGDGKYLDYSFAGDGNVTITGLDPNAEYEVLVRNVTATPDAVVLHNGAPVPPDASAFLDPANPRVGHMTVIDTSSSNDYILVSPAGIVLEVLTGNNNDLDFTSALLPGQEYKVYVVGTGTGGVTAGDAEGSISGGTSVTRRVPAANADVGGTVTATVSDEGGAGSASITLNPTSNDVQYAVVDSTGNVVGGTWIPGNGSSITFTGLDPSEDYEIVAIPKGDTPTTGQGDYTGKGTEIRMPAATAAIDSDNITREEDTGNTGKNKITLVGTETAQEYALLDASGNIVGGWVDGDNPGSTIVWDALDPNVAYKVVTRTKADGSNDASLPTAGISVPKLSNGGSTPPYIGGGGTSTNSVINSGTGGTVTISPTNPAKDDKVTITVKPDAGYALDKLTITDANGEAVSFIDNGDGTYTYTQPGGKVTIAATFKAIKDDDVTDDGNSDVSALLNTDDHIAYVSGRGDNMFEPNANMSRAEVAQMFYNLLRDKNVGGTTSFNDVSSDAWYADAVDALASLGILTGFPDGGFHPNDKITRAEFATIAVRFATISQGSSRFNDVPETHWAYQYINTAANFGWVTGVGEGYFEPDRNITRAEAVTLVNRMLERTPDKEYIDANAGSLTSFSDVPTTHWAYYNVMEASNAHNHEKSGTVEIWN